MAPANDVNPILSGAKKIFLRATRSISASLGQKSKGFMHEFAIHLIASPGTGDEYPEDQAAGGRPHSLVWVEPRSVMAALALARRCAPPGSVVEVWRDHECVHRETVRRETLQ
jgi:hypothetical protein